MLPNIYKPFHQYRLDGARLDYVGLRNESVASLNRAFFRDHAETPLAALVKSAQATRFQILIGRNDDLIGIEHAEALREIPNARLTILDDFSHRPRSAEQHSIWYGLADQAILAASKRD